MKYISTRGQIAPVSFKEAVMMGLSRDGGLLLPESIPSLSGEEERLALLCFSELSCEVISLFAPDCRDDLPRIIDNSYSTFTHPEVTPLVAKGGVHILELFHGPTLAFKDVALQFLGNMFEYLLSESGTHMNILGATSGDTGSAAIYGVRGKDRINIFIIHPHKRVSPIQELQMTTVLDSNVFNMAIRGTFDDGQAIVKTIFNDLEFKDAHSLGAINSINWARIVAQVVYYIYAALRFPAGLVDFSVPTGNFGDIFAGFIARKMLPQRIGKLVLATNDNDLLSRFVSAGDYSLGQVKQTSSPSMDIQVASNFERYLYFLKNRDSGATKAAMEDFGVNGSLTFTDRERAEIKETFLTLSVDENRVEETIRSFYTDTGYTCDPHTAVGVCAGLHHKRKDVPMVCLATAHPAKFADAVLKATGKQPENPKSIADLGERESRCVILDADVEQVKEFVEKNGL